MKRLLRYEIAYCKTDLQLRPSHNQCFKFYLTTTAQLDRHPVVIVALFCCFPNDELSSLNLKNGVKLNQISLHNDDTLHMSI